MRRLFVYIIWNFHLISVSRFPSTFSIYVNAKNRIGITHSRECLNLVKILIEVPKHFQRNLREVTLILSDSAKNIICTTFHFHQIISYRKITITLPERKVTFLWEAFVEAFISTLSASIHRCQIISCPNRTFAKPQHFPYIPHFPLPCSEFSHCPFTLFIALSVEKNLSKTMLFV